MDNSHLLLPRIGRVRMKEELRWPGKAIRECRIREHGGRWYASVRLEIGEEEYTPTTVAMACWVLTWA